MDNKIKVKFCGINNLENLKMAVGLDADYYGLNLYQPSPRSIHPDRIQDFLNLIPQGKRVVVSVKPDAKEMELFIDAGFDFFQIHFDPEETGIVSKIRDWHSALNPEQLWLVPRHVPGKGYPVWTTEYCRTSLVDAYSKSLYGGSGKVGNWELFAQLKTSFMNHRWILAGGLNPDNIKEAIAKTGTETVDLASGIETVPGIKDESKMKAILAYCRDHY